MATFASTIAGALKSASTLKSSGSLREAATTVASAKGPGDGRKLASRPTSPGAGGVARYNRQKPLKEKVRAARSRKNPTSITDSGVEEG